MSIVCVGCSMTQGHDIDTTESWPYMLHNALDIPVMNLGLCGSSMDTYLERLLLYKKKYNPKYALIQLTNPGRVQIGINGLSNLDEPNTDIALGYRMDNIGNYNYIVDSNECYTRMYIRTSHRNLTVDKINEQFIHKFSFNGITNSISKIKDFLDFYSMDVLSSDHRKKIWIKEMYTLQEFLKNEFEDYRMFLWEHSPLKPNNSLYLQLLDGTKFIGGLDSNNINFNMESWLSTLNSEFVKNNMVDGIHYGGLLNKKLVEDFILPEILEWNYDNK